MGLIGDWLSDGFNDILKGLILGMAAFVGDIIDMIFTIDSRTTDGRPTDVDLQAATSIGNLVLVLALPLTIAAVIWQIMRSTAQGRAQGVLRAVVGGVAMVAATRIVFWYAPELVRGFDETTVLLLDAFDAGPGGIGTTLMQGVGLQKIDDEWRSTDGGEYEVPGWMTFSAAAGNPLGVPLILWLLMGLGALMLMLMLAFRRWALVAMIAVVPLAVMFLPAEKASKSIIGTWVKVFVSLVAAKPLAAIILSISAKMLSVSAQMNLVMFIAAFVGLLAAALAPLIAMQFFNFLGAEVADGYARAAGEGAAKLGAQKVHRGGQMLASAGRSMGGSGRRTPAPVPNRTPGNGSGGAQGKPSAVPNRPVGQPPSPGQQGRPPQGGRPPGSDGGGSRPTPARGAGSGAAGQPRPVPQQRN